MVCRLMIFQSLYQYRDNHLTNLQRTTSSVYSPFTTEKRLRPLFPFVGSGPRQQ